MKIGILTYHFANNYGAMLQCYGLKTALRELGNECDVINYVSNKQSNNNSLYRHGGLKNRIKNCLLFFFRSQRSECHHKMEEFRFDLCEDKPRISSIDALSSHVNENDYDIIISGSDQVWNPHVDDFEDSFFIPFKTTASKIAYAASIGKATTEDLAAYKKWIDDFQYITVREKSACSILKRITDREIISVADPVILLSAKQWRNLSNTTNVEADKSLVCYFVKKENLNLKIQMAKDIARKDGLKLLIISPRITKYNITMPGNILSNVGPQEFLAYIDRCTSVFTDSFHGTIFSILFHKNFITIEDERKTKDSRKKDLLEQVGLTDRIQYIKDQTKVFRPVDYDKVDLIVEDLRAQAIDTISNITKDIEQRMISKI